MSTQALFLEASSGLENKKGLVMSTPLLRKIIACALFFPFLAIVVLGVILFFTQSFLILKVLWGILIISTLLSIGGVLFKISHLSQALGIRNPIGELYPIVNLGAIFGLWAVLAAAIIGICTLSGLPSALENLNSFLAAFRRFCPWWPR